MTTTTEKADFTKLLDERRAANTMRDDLSFLVGWFSNRDESLSQRLQEILDNHKRKRCQDCF